MRLASPVPLESAAVARELDGVQLYFVEVFRTCASGLLHQELVDIGAVPMRICDGIVRAGANEQFVRAFRTWLPRLPEFVVVEGEPTLEPAGELRMCALPRAPFAQRQHRIQL